MRKWTQMAEERDSLRAMTPAFVITRPKAPGSHIIFASPHSGACYPDSFTARSACTLTDLRRNEDAYIDALLSCVADFGAPLLAANFPRCYVDANRAPDEMPPGMPSVLAKARAVSKAVSLPMVSTSSIRSRSRISGMNPAPMP